MPVVARELHERDLSFLFEQLAAIRVADEDRRLRQRYLTLLLGAVHTSGTPLSGPPPSWQEIGERWETRE